MDPPVSYSLALLSTLTESGIGLMPNPSQNAVDLNTQQHDYHDVCLMCGMQLLPIGHFVGLSFSFSPIRIKGLSSRSLVTNQVTGQSPTGRVMSSL